MQAANEIKPVAYGCVRDIVVLRHSSVTSSLPFGALVAAYAKQVASSPDAHRINTGSSTGAITASAVIAGVRVIAQCSKVAS